jgi:hypothetical protein
MPMQRRNNGLPAGCMLREAWTGRSVTKPMVVGSSHGRGRS